VRTECGGKGAYEDGKWRRKGIRRRKVEEERLEKVEVEEIWEE
jgi:hypothetical protein